MLTAFKIFENDNVVAFLDAHPLAIGHTLLIPKKHVSHLENLEWNDASHLFKALLILVEKIHLAVKTSSSTIAINNGPESGQEIPHLHIHIIPRFINDTGGPIHTIIKSRPHISKYNMKNIAYKIRQYIAD